MYIFDVMYRRANGPSGAVEAAAFSHANEFWHVLFIMIFFYLLFKPCSKFEGVRNSGLKEETF